jgi:proteasome lid subunit RPN8/RPN11
MSIACDLALDKGSVDSTLDSMPSSRVRDPFIEGATNTMRNLYLIALSLLLGVAKATDPLPAVTTYTSRDAAAIAVLTEAEAAYPGVEAGSTVYQCGAVYRVAPIYSNGEKDYVDIMVYDIEGCTLAAAVHTHPKGAARFSNTDIAALLRLHTIGYIKPLGGAVRSLDCAAIHPTVLQDVNSQLYLIASKGQTVR